MQIGNHNNNIMEFKKKSEIRTVELIDLTFLSNRSKNIDDYKMY